MKAVTKILTGAAGLALAAGAFAAPASAQYYPGYGGGLGDVIVGTVVNQVLRGAVGGYGNQGYNQYGYGNNQQALVGQCARAAEQRASGYNGGYNSGYGGYGNQGYGNYGYGNAGARVVQITSVERKSGGDLRVRGLMSSGAYAGNSGYGAYGYGNAQADLRFSCRVDYRGAIRDLDLDRVNTAYGYRRY